MLALYAHGGSGKNQCFSSPLFSLSLSRTWFYWSDEDRESCAKPMALLLRKTLQPLSPQPLSMHTAKNRVVYVWYLHEHIFPLGSVEVTWAIYLSSLATSLVSYNYVYVLICKGFNGFLREKCPQWLHRENMDVRVCPKKNVDVCEIHFWAFFQVGLVKKDGRDSRLVLLSVNTTQLG